VTRIKICGLTRESDAWQAIDSGADVLGFVLEPNSPRFLGDDIPKWLETLPSFPPKTAVFGHVNRGVPKGVFDFVQGAEWTVLQESFAKRIHTLRIRPGQSADDFTSQTVKAGIVLLDAHSEGAYGGTGKRIDWDLAAEIVQRSDRPVMLAGGLTPENVADAIRRVRPYAVDVSSGIEGNTPGIKDVQKLRDFVAAVREAG
jgi:phosphoribosylanthranilate isomerase